MNILRWSITVRRDQSIIKPFSIWSPRITQRMIPYFLTINFSTKFGKFLNWAMRTFCDPFMKENSSLIFRENIRNNKHFDLELMPIMSVCNAICLIIWTHLKLPKLTLRLSTNFLYGHMSRKDKYIVFVKYLVPSTSIYYRCCKGQ